MSWILASEWCRNNLQHEDLLSTLCTLCTYFFITLACDVVNRPILSLCVNDFGYGLIYRYHNHDTAQLAGMKVRMKWMPWWLEEESLVSQQSNPHRKGEIKYQQLKGHTDFGPDSNCLSASQVLLSHCHKLVSLQICLSFTCLWECSAPCITRSVFSVSGGSLYVSIAVEIASEVV